MKKARVSGNGAPDDKSMHLRIEELENEVARLRKALDEKKDQEQIVRSRLELKELSLTESFENILTAVVDSAERLTSSKIAFFHFYDDHKQTLKLQTWSTNTSMHCSANPADHHYDLANAGVWTDCIKEGKPVIHNNYQRLQHRKGQPYGHVNVVRELTVPILREGIIVGVLGVGNKDSDYDSTDVYKLTQFAEIAWEIVVNKQLNLEIEKREDHHSALLKTMFEGVALNELIFDDNGDVSDYRILEVNSSFDKHSPRKAVDVEGKLASEAYKMDREYIRKFWHDNYFTEKPVITDYYDQGTERWLRISTSPLKDNKFTTVFFDITDIKMAEKALGRIREDLEEAQHISKIGSWEYFKDTKVLNCSSETRRIFGLDSANPVLKYEDFHLRVAEQDWLDMGVEIKKSIQTGTEKFSHEFRISKDNGFAWVHVIGKVIRSDDGSFREIKGTVQDITERKKAETALNHSHDLMRYIIEHNRGAVAVHDREMRYIYVSQRYLTDYQIKDTDIIGKHHYEVFPDLPKKWKKAHQEALKGRVLRMEDDTYPREDGTIEWTRWECRPWYEADNSIGGIIVYTEVITERKKIELALKNSELQLNAMFNSAPVIMILLDEKSEILKMNKFGMEFTGLETEYPTGLRPGNVLNCINAVRDPEGCGFSPFCKSCVLRNTVTATFKSGREFFKVEAQVISGRSENIINRTVLVSTSVISSFPEKMVLVTIDDITERKELENELIKARDKAEESDRLKSAFLANISHEIRTPMNGIMGFSEMLMKPGLSEEKKRNFSNLIQDGCRQLLSIITDVIEISMLDSDQMSVIKTRFKINEFMQGLVLQFRSSARYKNLRLKFVKGRSDPTIITDREKLEHIFSNLISNAIKFTKHGNIEFGYNLKGNNFEFFVSDTGIGIEKELFEVIFERFRQVEVTDTRNYPGAGLGLSIVKGLIALLDGRIWLESEPGTGTTFFFTIPAPGSETKSLNDHSGRRIAENKILVAEDDDINYLFIQEVLQDINCLPYHAKNGVEALRILKEHPEVRLIFMDIKMPVMDGIKAAHLIKELYPVIPVYAQTAFPISSSEELKKYGFHGCIPKPINKEKLISVVRKHLGNSD